MAYSMAQVARALAGWNPATRRRRAKVDDALRWLMGSECTFMRNLHARLRWVCQHWPEMLHRFPVNPLRGDRTVDDGQIADLGQSLLLFLLTPGKAFGGFNAFGALARRMDEDGRDWSDAACVTFLLGRRGKQYPLPQRGRSAGDCPAIWRCAAAQWHFRTEQQRRTMASFTASAGGEEILELAGQRVVGRRNGATVYASAQPGARRARGGVESLLAAIRRWPGEHQRLFLEAFSRDSGILKSSTVGRLHLGAETASHSLAKCFSIRAVEKLLNIPRSAAEALVRDFCVNLLALPAPSDGLSIQEILVLSQGTATHSEM